MTAEDTIHISSAVVSVLPKHRDEVLRMLAALTEVETLSKQRIANRHRDGSGREWNHGWLSRRDCIVERLSANLVFEQVERAADIGD